MISIVILPAIRSSQDQRIHRSVHVVNTQSLLFLRRSMTPSLVRSKIRQFFLKFSRFLRQVRRFFLNSCPLKNSFLSTILDQLLNRIKDEVRRLHRRHQLKTSTNEVVDDEINTSADLTSQESRSTSSTNNQQYLLTLAQVNLICARLLKEREEVLREEYDRILSNKLNGIYSNFFYIVE